MPNENPHRSLGRKPLALSREREYSYRGEKEVQTHNTVTHIILNILSFVIYLLLLVYFQYEHIFHKGLDRTYFETYR